MGHNQPTALTDDDRLFVPTRGLHPRILVHNGEVLIAQGGGFRAFRPTTATPIEDGVVGLVDPATFRPSIRARGSAPNPFEGDRLELMPVKSNGEYAAEIGIQMTRDPRPQVVDIDRDPQVYTFVLRRGNGGAHVFIRPPDVRRLHPALAQNDFVWAELPGYGPELLAQLSPKEAGVAYIGSVRTNNTRGRVITSYDRIARTDQGIDRYRIGFDEGSMTYTVGSGNAVTEAKLTLKGVEETLFPTRPLTLDVNVLDDVQRPGEFVLVATHSASVWTQTPDLT